MLNVQRLRILTEVVGRGSFSAAAESLAYTQSAVSQAIATLEAEAGATLLERDRKGVRPTPAGAVLVQHAEGILAQLEAAEADVASVVGLRTGRLRMASFPTAGATLMPIAIARFRAAHPAIELSLAEGEPEEIAPRLRAGEFDLALLFEFPDTRPHVDQGLRRVAVLDDPLHVVIPAGHRLAGKEQLDLADLRPDAWIQTSADSPCARYVVRSCHAAGFEPTVSFETDDYGTVLGLVAAGVGVALIPQLALRGLRGDVVVREVHPPVVRQVFAATRHSAGVAPAAQSMIELLGDVASEYGPELAVAS